MLLSQYKGTLAIPDTDIIILSTDRALTRWRAPPIHNTVWAGSDINYLYLNTQYLLWVAADNNSDQENNAETMNNEFQFRPVATSQSKNQMPLDGVWMWLQFIINGYSRAWLQL